MRERRKKKRMEWRDASESESLKKQETVKGEERAKSSPALKSQ